MTENLNAMTPAERELWRVKKVQEEETEYQSRMQRQAELKLQRTQAFDETKAQRQLVAKSLHGHSKVLVVVRGEVREASIRAGIVNEPGVLRGFFGGLELPNCLFLDLPEGFGRLREIFEVIGHPKDLPPFEERGEIFCQRHLSRHPSVLLFKGLQLTDLGLEACSCSSGGPGHRYRNSSNSSLSFAPWSIRPGELFDVPEGGQEIVEAYLSSGFVEDLRSPRKKKAQEEKAKPKTSEEILEEAVSNWERDDD